MADFSGVYRITNTVNGKVYVGSSVRVKRRIYNHKASLRNNRHENKHMQAAWAKYGADAFVFEPLLICSVENVLFYEQLLIDGFEATNRKKGYNKAILAGSNVGVKHSEEAKAKMSAASKRPCSEETKIKISEAQKGRSFSAERRARMSVSHTGKVLTAEHKAKIAVAGLGRIPTAKAKENMRAAQKGKTVSAETKAKISASLKGTIISAETRAKNSKAHTGAKRSAESCANMKAAQVKRRRDAKLAKELASV